MLTLKEAPRKDFYVSECFVKLSGCFFIYLNFHLAMRKYFERFCFHFRSHKDGALGPVGGDVSPDPSMVA